MKIQNIKTAHIVRVRIELSGSMIDSGTVVIIFIILAIFVIYTIKHEWCPVLFKNNTVSNRYVNKFLKFHRTSASLEVSVLIIFIIFPWEGDAVATFWA